MGGCLSGDRPLEKADVQTSIKTGDSIRTTEADYGYKITNPPSELVAWSVDDVERWAAGLGLPKASLAALKGLSGQQVLQLTDQRLLQLGVKDAAERYALLTARSSLLPQPRDPDGQPNSGDAGSAGSEGGAQAPTAGAGVAHTASESGNAASPKPLSTLSHVTPRLATGLRNTATDGGGELQDHSQSALSHAQTLQDSAAVSVKRGASFTEGVARHSEELRDMQVLRITANGRLFRHSRAVPVSLTPYCQALCMLHDLRRGAHYHYDNCHQLLQRCVLVQDYLLALPHTELRRMRPLLARLSLLVQDAYDVFRQFSDRGWLLRLLGNVRDQDDFARLDTQLVTALEGAGVDMTEPPLADLRHPREYAPQQQQLENALRHLGGISKLLRDPLAATIRLQSLLHHLPSGSNIDALLQQEIEHYLSSALLYADGTGSSAGGFGLVSAADGIGGAGRSTTREDSFRRTDSSSSASSGPARVGSGGAGGLRRSSSIGPPGSRGTAALALVEPFLVLRNDTVRAEWRSAFGGRERVTWKEFWHKLVQPQAHLWGLDQQLDKFTTDFVQQHVQRGSHGLLTIAEMDFAFPPHCSPAVVVQARLKEHSSVSSSALPSVQLAGSSETGSACAAADGSSAGVSGMLPGIGMSARWRGGGAVGWLRDVRLLQEPTPRLHNFPELPPGFYPRTDEVAELALGMADVSTTLVMLTGAPGVGRSMLAACLAQELVLSQHWVDAYWVDLQGVSNVILAGQQLLYALGLTSDVPDPQQLLAWLEGRPRERCGIVITHAQELLSGPAEEQREFLQLIDNILHSSHKLQVVLVCDEALTRITYQARTVEVQPLLPAAAHAMVKAAQPSVSEACSALVEACQGAPVALGAACGLLRYGICDADALLKVYCDASLPAERSLADTCTSTYLPFESRTTAERLQRVLVAALVALPDDLVTSLLVLALLPAPFTFELVAPLLALPATVNERRAVLRRLVNMGLLGHNRSLQQYSVHKLVRDAARLLMMNLGLPYAETRRRLAELLLASAQRLVLPLVARGRMLSARLAWARMSVHFVQLVGWALQEVHVDNLSLYVTVAWDLSALLASSCSSHLLQGFYNVLVERCQFHDRHLEAAQAMTCFGAALAEGGALKRADTTLRQALEFFWRELKAPHPAVARCYKELGALMLRAGKPTEAGKHLQQALELQEQLFGAASPELLPVLQLQTELMRRSRRFGEAEGICQRALGICGAAYGPADVQVALWKNQIAQVMRQSGHAADAQSLAQEALALLQGQLGGEHPRVAAQLMLLGQLAAAQGRQAAAEQSFRRALQVYQAVSGPQHQDTFSCLTSLVALLRSAGKASHALPLAQRCLAVKKRSLGELHADTTAAMQVVADVMLDLGRYAEVESICGRAVLLHQQLNTPPSSKPVLVAKTMRALALVLLGRAAEAEPLAVSCLEAVHSMPGPPAERSSFLASCHNCHAEVLRELGRLNDAETAAREGLALREKDLGTQHPVVAISLQTLGHVLRTRQQLPQALEAAQRCEALRVPQGQGPLLASAQHLQALILLDMGRLEESLAKGQAALALRQKVLGSEHPDLAHSLSAVAEVLLGQGRYGEAEPLLSHAVQIFISQLGSAHPASQRTHLLLKQANNPGTRAGSFSLTSMRLAPQSVVPDAGTGQQPVSATQGPPGPAAAPEDDSAKASDDSCTVVVPETEATELAHSLSHAASGSCGGGGGEAADVAEVAVSAQVVGQAAAVAAAAGEGGTGTVDASSSTSPAAVASATGAAAAAAAMAPASGVIVSIASCVAPQLHRSSSNMPDGWSASGNADINSSLNVPAAASEPLGEQLLPPPLPPGAAADVDADVAMAVVAGEPGDADEAEADRTASEDDKLDKLRGLSDIEDLRSFLREHGWQLSRLSVDDRSAMAPASVLEAAAGGGASVASSGQQGAGAALPAGTAGEGERPATTTTTSGGQVVAAAPNSTNSSAERLGGAGGRTGERRLPARHLSFVQRQQPAAARPAPVRRDTTAVLLAPQQHQQLQQQQHPPPRPLGLVQDALLSVPIPGMLPPSLLQQQQRLLGAQQHAALLQAQGQAVPRAPPGAWGMSWPQQHMTEEGQLDEEAAAEQEELYLQQVAAAEAEAAAALQSWAVHAAAQQQQQARAAAATAAVDAGAGGGLLAPGGGGVGGAAAELGHRLVQLRQQFSGASGGTTRHMLSDDGTTTAQLQRQYAALLQVQQQRHHQQQQAAAAAAATAAATAAAAAQHGLLDQQHCQLQTAGSSPQPLTGGGGSSGRGHHPSLHVRSAGGSEHNSLPLHHSLSQIHKGSGSTATGTGMQLPKQVSNMSNYSVGSGWGSLQTHGTDSGGSGGIGGGGPGSHAELGSEVEQQQAGGGALSITARARAALGTLGLQGLVPEAAAGTATPRGLPLSQAGGISARARTTGGGGGGGGGDVSSLRSSSFTSTGRQRHVAWALSPEEQQQAAASGSAALYGSGGVQFTTPQQQQQQQVMMMTRPVGPSHSPYASLADTLTDSLDFESLDALHATVAMQQQLANRQQQQQQQSYGALSALRGGGGDSSSLSGLPHAAVADGVAEAARPSPALSMMPSGSLSGHYTMPGWGSVESPGGQPALDAAARAHQQLLLQQQVLQVQAARLELQKQQLEIEQLLSEQQQQQQQQQHAATNTAAASAMAPMTQQQQQQHAHMQAWQRQGSGQVSPTTLQCGAATQWHAGGGGHSAHTPGGNSTLAALHTLQHAGSTASNLSMGSGPVSPRPAAQRSMGGSSAHTGGSSGGPSSSTPAAAAATATAAGADPSNNASAIAPPGALQQQQQQQAIMHAAPPAQLQQPATAGLHPRRPGGGGLGAPTSSPLSSMMLTPGGSCVPSSPSRSSSLSSRAPLSRGTSDNQDAQVAAAVMAQQQQQQLMGGAGAAAAASQYASSSMRAGTGGKAVASAAQQQYAPMMYGGGLTPLAAAADPHPQHQSASSELQQSGGAAAAAADAAAGARMSHAPSPLLHAGGGGPQAPAWPQQSQQQQQQQQQLLLLQQQLLQQQQQLQQQLQARQAVAQHHALRMQQQQQQLPAQQLPFSALLGPARGYGVRGSAGYGTGGTHPRLLLPHANLHGSGGTGGGGAYGVNPSDALTYAMVAQQQQQQHALLQQQQQHALLQQQQQQQLWHQQLQQQSLATDDDGHRDHHPHMVSGHQGLTGLQPLPAMPQRIVPPSNQHVAAPAPATTTTTTTTTAAASTPFSAHQEHSPVGNTGAGGQAGGGGGMMMMLMRQQHQVLAAHAAAASALRSQLLARQQGNNSFASTGTAGGGGGGSSTAGGLPQTEGEEDYGMWAASPDFGGLGGSGVAAGVSSSGPSEALPTRSGSVTRSFIAPGGGQFWEGRRSNSFSNLHEDEAAAVLRTGDAAAEAVLHTAAGGIVRSRSSEELPRLPEL